MASWEHESAIDFATRLQRYANSPEDFVEELRNPKSYLCTEIERETRSIAMAYLAIAYTIELAMEKSGPKSKRAWFPRAEDAINDLDYTRCKSTSIDVKLGPNQKLGKLKIEMTYYEHPALAIRLTGKEAVLAKICDRTKFPRRCGSLASQKAVYGVLRNLGLAKLKGCRDEEAICTVISDLQRDFPGEANTQITQLIREGLDFSVQEVEEQSSLLPKLAARLLSQFLPQDKTICIYMKPIAISELPNPIHKEALILLSEVLLFSNPIWDRQDSANSHNPHRNTSHK